MRESCCSRANERPTPWRPPTARCLSWSRPTVGPAAIERTGPTLVRLSRALIDASVVRQNVEPSLEARDMQVDAALRRIRDRIAHQIKLQSQLAGLGGVAAPLLAAGRS